MIAQMFDPIGYLTPFFIKAKYFIQELWAKKIDWDIKSKSAQVETWRNFLQSLTIGRTLRKCRS